MSINLTDEIEVKTKKGKLGAAKQIFLDGDQENLQQIGDKTHQLENAVKDIAATGGASTANAVSYSNEASGITAVTAQGAIDELVTKNKSQDAIIAEKAKKSDVQTSVSELKKNDSALSAELAKKANASDVTSKFTEESERVNGELAKKANTADVTSQMQTEQSRVNTELAKKFNSENIAQESGDSEDKVMSQKAVSSKFNDISNKTDKIFQKYTQEETDSIEFQNESGESIGKIDENGADFVSLKKKGIEVLTEHQDISNLATKEEVNEKQNKIKEITSEDSTEGVDEIEFKSDDNKQTYAKINNNGISSKGYYDLKGNRIDTALGNLETSNIPSDDEEFSVESDDGKELYAAAGKYGIKAKDFYDLEGNTIVNKHILCVGINHKYKTISEAVADAVDDDIILIFPGVYEETINVSGWTLKLVNNSYEWEWYKWSTNPNPPKNLHFIGVNRESCIVVNYTGEYAMPPFFMLQGTLRNLTIKAIHKEGVDYSNIKKANYCIHYDGNNYNYYDNKKMLIENCILIADNQDCIGAGALRKGCKIVVKDCYLEQMASHRCFGIHNNPNHNEDYIFEAELYNNVMKSNQGYCVELTSWDNQPDYCKIDLIACGNVMYSQNFGRDAFKINDSSKKITLNNISFGNSAELMNK